MGDLPSLLAVLVAATFVAGCSSPSSTDGDADVDADADGEVATDAGGDAARDADESAEGDADADLPEEGPLPGPLTLLATEMRLVEDRVCDLDGDGALDNAVADLGGTGAMVVLTAINTLLSGDIDEGMRLLTYAPHVDDLRRVEAPDVPLLFLAGVDADDPPDPADDFSGSEPFHATHWGLDPCGEPLYYFEHVSFSRGNVEATGGTIPVPLTDSEWIPARQAALFGTIERGGVGGEATFCGLLLIADLGERWSAASPDLTQLELFLAGGAAVGIPGLSGLNPDVDLDGDGLERLVTDDEHRIASCVDGDGTVWGGRDCWSDPRMADAFSVTATTRYTGAGFAGREPGWEDRVTGECTDPPEQSLFEPI